MPLPAQLRALGVVPGDTLMLHASMRAVGCRADELLDALQQTIGPKGSLLMLICAPEEPPFHPQTSPAWDELGVLSEVFRTRPGVILNAHPITRMGAWGARAEALVEEPPLDDYYGPGSPLERLVAVGGKVLRMGADEDTTTLFHHAEYLAEVSDKRRTEHRVRVTSPAGGCREICVRCLDDEVGIRPWEGPDYFSLILRELLAAGLASQGRVGNAPSHCIPAAQGVAFAKAWMERHLQAPGQP
ncbi:MAG: AAC(3) family N-acetyltransferase [Myxococcota bacterium]|nr:AAC(3) family N-acetyltransferase [Myxococcota bacterium]